MRGLFVFLGLIAAQLAAAAQVAITVDDLPTTGAQAPGISRLQVARTLLEAFKKHQTPPIYGFINAVSVERVPELKQVLQEWVEAGHPLANHTYAHLDLNQLSLEEYLSQIDQNEPMLRELSRGMDFHFFRYPFLKEGETFAKRDGIRDHLARNGYQLAPVTIEFADYKWNAPYARCVAAGDETAIAWLKQSYVTAAVANLRFSEEFAQRIFGREIKHVLLMHIGALNAAAMDDLLTALHQANVELVTLQSALSDEIYSINPNVISHAGMNHLDRLARARSVRYPPTPEIPTERLNSICRL